jgi:hypothetical protein
LLSSLILVNKKFENDSSQDTRAAANIINTLISESGEILAEKMLQLAAKVKESGTLQSVLMDIKGVIVYALIFPSLHDKPTLLKRYEPFAKGWVNHINEVRQAIALEKQGGIMVELMLFLSLSQGEGAIHLAYQSGEFQLLPALLLNSSEVKDTRGLLCEARQII